MTTRPTTLVESDQLAQAAANILKSEDFVPKGKRWPFARTSKAHRDYDRAVQEITARRRQARESAVERRTKRARADADIAYERAKAKAQSLHDDKIAEIKRPYDEVEAKARSERDAAIAAANLAYQQTMEKADRVYRDQAEQLDQARDAVLVEASGHHDQAYAAVEAERKAGLDQIARDLRMIALEGPMRIVEDKEAWPVQERKKALIGIIDMAGEEILDAESVDVCLRNVAGYVFQDRFLPPDGQHHKLLDVSLLEALVDLALRNAQRRPAAVSCLYEVVTNHPGHSSATFIKNLTQLYVEASTDTYTVYARDPAHNESIVENMRAQIADVLKLTPRRSQPASGPVSHPAPPGETSEAVEDDDHSTPVMEMSAADITADVSISDLIPVESPDESSAADAADAPNTESPSASSSESKRPPPLRPHRVRTTPEGT